MDRKIGTKIISAIKCENPDQTSVYQMIAENIYLNFKSEHMPGDYANRLSGYGLVFLEDVDSGKHKKQGKPLE